MPEAAPCAPSPLSESLALAVVVEAPSKPKVAVRSRTSWWGDLARRRCFYGHGCVAELRRGRGSVAAVGVFMEARQGGVATRA
jgi:hypothetical protein